MMVNGIDGVSMANMATASSPIQAMGAVMAPLELQAPLAATALSGIGLTRMDLLVDLIRSFTASEIIMALLLADSQKAHDRIHHSHALDDILALQLSMLLFQSIQSNTSGNVQSLQSCQSLSSVAIVGAQLNVAG